MFERAGADTADATRYVLVGAPRNLVSVRGVQCRSVDLRASHRIGLEVVFDDDDDRVLHHAG